MFTKALNPCDQELLSVAREFKATVATGYKVLHFEHPLVTAVAGVVPRFNIHNFKLCPESVHKGGLEIGDNVSLCHDANIHEFVPQWRAFMRNFAYFRPDQHDVMTPPFFPVKKDGDAPEPQTPVYCDAYMNYVVRGFGAGQRMDVIFPEVLKDGSGFDFEPLLKQKILGRDGTDGPKFVFGPHLFAYMDFVAATAIFPGLADPQVDRELYNEMLADYLVHDSIAATDGRQSSRTIFMNAYQEYVRRFPDAIKQVRRRRAPPPSAPVVVDVDDFIGDVLLVDAMRKRYPTMGIGSPAAVGVRLSLGLPSRGAAEGAAEGGGGGGRRSQQPPPDWTRRQAPRKDSVDELLLSAGFGEIDVFGIDEPLAQLERIAALNEVVHRSAWLSANPGRTLAMFNSRPPAPSRDNIFWESRFFLAGTGTISTG